MKFFVRGLVIVIVTAIALFFGTMFNEVNGKELHVAMVFMGWLVVVWKIIKYKDGMNANT